MLDFRDALDTAATDRNLPQFPGILFFPKWHGRHGYSQPFIDNVIARSGLKHPVVFYPRSEHLFKRLQHIQFSDTILQLGWLPMIDNRMRN